MFQFFKNKYILAFIVYALCLAIRLCHIQEPALQSDEEHWIKRSSQILTKLKSDPLNTTTHLAHPGIPAAWTMAVGELIATKINTARNYRFGDKNYIDAYSAARISIAFFSSLLAPLIVLGFVSYLGTGISLLAALLVSLDSQHIFLSRIAHLDTTMCFLVVLTTLIYYRAIITNNDRGKLLAGVFWGLCIATKPTAVALIAGFITFNFLLWIFTKKEKRTSIVTWGDVWAVYLGHLIFALIYTRFWHHPSHYVEIFKFHNGFGDFVYDLGTYLQSHQTISVVLLLVLGFGLSRLKEIWNLKASPVRYRHLINFWGLTFAILLPLIVFPQVLENIIRYWGWVFGLSGVKHDGFGQHETQHPLRYFGLFLSSVSPIIVAAFLIAVVKLISQLISHFKLKSLSKESHFLLFIFTITIIWLLPLSISPKQSWRYALPIVPFIYTLAAFGIFTFVNLIKNRIPYSRYILPLAALSILACHLFSIAPRYELFHSRLGGSFNAAIDRGQIRPLYGINEGLDFLLSEKNKPNFTGGLVTVTGDTNAVKASAARRMKLEKNAFNFAYFPSYSAHYVFAIFGMGPPHGAIWDKILTKEPIFRVAINSIPIVSIWKVPLYEFSEPITINVSSQTRTVGRVRQNTYGDTIILARPEKFKAGYITNLAHKIRTLAGNYEIIVPLAFEDNIDPNIYGEANSKVVSFSFGDSCKKTVFKNELLKEKILKFSLKCSVLMDQGIKPKVYWFGIVPVALHDFTIRKIDSKSKTIETKEPK